MWYSTIIHIVLIAMWHTVLPGGRLHPFLPTVSPLLWGHSLSPTPPLRPSIPFPRRRGYLTHRTHVGAVARATSAFARTTVVAKVEGPPQGREDRPPNMSRLWLIHPPLPREIVKGESGKLSGGLVRLKLSFFGGGGGLLFPVNAPLGSCHAGGRLSRRWEVVRGPA